MRKPRATDHADFMLATRDGSAIEHRTPAQSRPSDHALRYRHRPRMLPQLRQILSLSLASARHSLRLLADPAMPQIETHMAITLLTSPWPASAPSLTSGPSSLAHDVVSSHRSPAGDAKGPPRPSRSAPLLACLWDTPQSVFLELAMPSSPVAAIYTSVEAASSSSSPVIS